MDFLERFNSKFGKWYESLFGGEAGELRPKDVLRKITTAMEDHRKEGLDGKVYVPNKYILELALDDAEERDYLLSFLDEEELVGVLKKFMAQHQYHARGPLDFTIAEVPADQRTPDQEKLRVRVRFEKGEVSAAPSLPSPAASVEDAEDMATVARVDYDADEEAGTVPAVAWAALAITHPDGRKSHFSLTRPSITIGRSRNAGNELVLENDGMASKVHARIERERDGSFTLYDLGSTNGVQINGRRIEGNRMLENRDEIRIGQTQMVFQREGAEAPAPQAPAPSNLPVRARLLESDGTPHVLASETLIGRAITSDIVLSDPSVAMKHARIVTSDLATYALEALTAEGRTTVNDAPLTPGDRIVLEEGDAVEIGRTTLRFTGGRG